MNNKCIFENFTLRDESYPVKVIPNCAVARAGHCITASGLASESFHSGYQELRRELYWLTMLQLGKRGFRFHDTKVPVILFHNCWSGGYYHWLIEAMPRLLSLKAAWGQSPIFLPPSVPNKWFRGWLAEVSEGNVIKADRGVTLLSNVILQENPHVISDICGKDLRETAIYFKEIAFKKWRRQSAGGCRKVYISRKKACHRKVANDEEVARFLRDEGFCTVFLEEMDFPEQVRTFHDAEVVLSIHGAGLANAIFMKPGAHVIEVFQRPHVEHTYGSRRKTHLLNPCYKAICEAMGIVHHVVFGVIDPESLRSAFVKRLGSLHANIFVDIASLRPLGWVWQDV